ncbi:hypothetical protein BGX33_005016 [Mortierella sp. NVP41]|nr:hypothetical protein BGX33_005016 [Mortierella sp. NVP41]
MVATEGSLDKFLLTALQNRQDRLFLLKLEREYCNFIEDPSEDVLEFPWLNSYYRMMIHRSAIYFQLARKVDANQKKITLSKSEHSAIPVLRFHELVEEEGEEDVPVKSFKVLRRCPPRPVSACEAREGTMSTTALVASAPTSSSTSSKHTVTPLSSSSSSSSIPLSDRRSVSFEQREKAYAEARARIFHKEGEEAAEEEEEDEDARTGITGDSGIKEKPRPISSSKATTPAGIAITIESQPPPKPEHGLSHAQGQGQGQAKARQYDLIRRTSTSSTISSSSSSSGTAMTEISSRSDFVGSWMAGNDGSSRSGYQGSSSGMIDHRTGRNNGAYCECGADHGLYGVAAAVGPGSEMSSGPQYNNNNINNSRRPCQHQEPSYHPSCPCQNHGSQGSSRHHVHGSHGSHGHHVGYPSSNRQRSSYPACHHHHQPFQHQHHFQHQHQHQVQHSHQHHPGYQHTVVTPSHGHPMICPPQQQQHRHPYYNQHQQHQYQQLHNQHYQPRQYQHQIHNHHYHAAPHPSYAHQQHHQHLQQHSHDQHQYNRGFQDPRCCEYVRSEMIPPGQGSMRPTDQIQEIQYSSSSTSSSSTEAATNHSSGLFQVSVRPYPSSNGYRPYRQGISLPQQLNRQGQQHRQQQQHHRHPQSQGQRQQQHRQQGSSNARQQQYRGNQQQHQQKQQLSVGSIDHHPQTHHSLNPSSTTIPTHTLSQGSKPREEKEEGESCNNSTKQAHSQSQQQQHQHMNTPARGGAMKGREESAMESTPRVYDVERRPPKSTELYDPYATPACGSGTKSRKH